MSNTVHPFWKWAWRGVLGLMLLPVILLPLAIIVEFVVMNFLKTGPYL